MSDKRILTPESEQSVLFDRMMLNVNTAIPGSIIEFDSSNCLATVKPAIKMKVVVPNKSGVLEVSYLDLPDIACVPVCLPHSMSGGLFITVPIKVGDPCLLVFSQRDISNFVQFGANQPPSIGASPATSSVRHHDMTDAICIPGLTNLKNTIPDWNQSAVEVRNSAGTVKISVETSKITAISGSTSMEISNSGINITGSVVVDGEVTANNIPLSTHIHSGVTVGGGNTGTPVP